MAKATTEPTKTAPRTSPEYSVEADAPRNNDLLMQSIPGVRLRSRILPNRPVIANRQGESRPIPRDQSRHLGAIPELPGMRLTVIPKELKYRIEDPFDEEMGENLRRALQSDDRPTNFDPNRPIKGVKTQEGVLDEDRFKTLCREIRNMLDAGEMREQGGSFLALEEIDQLPGRYLLNPGSRTRTDQPRYEDEYEEWAQRQGSLRG